jgi:general secretion pathway protein C
MDRAGLLPGDVVARVNGQQVGDIVGDQALFENIVASGRARLEVIREGETVVMSFPLR